MVTQLWPVEIELMGTGIVLKCVGEGGGRQSGRLFLAFFTGSCTSYVGCSSSFKDRTVNFACERWYKIQLHMSLRRFSTAICPNLLTSVLGGITEHVIFLSAAPVSHYPLWAEGVLCCLIFKGHKIFWTAAWDFSCQPLVLLRCQAYSWGLGMSSCYCACEEALAEKPISF